MSAPVTVTTTLVSDGQWAALCVCIVFLAASMPSSIGSELRDIATAINDLAKAIRETKGGDK